MSFSYARGEISSFVHAAREPYIRCMENRYQIRYPTTEELYAFELEARRLRAAEVSRLLKAGASAVRRLFARIVTVRNAKGLRHA
jgi:ribosomal protein L29